MSQSLAPALAFKAAFDRVRRSASPALLCLVLGLLGSVPLAILTPPFQVPDEQQHFARAYQLSEGSVTGTVEDGAAGAVLPSSIARLSDVFLGTRALHLPERVQPQRRLWDIWRLGSGPLDAEKREFVDFSGAVQYFPLPYLPQAAGIALGRWAGLGPLALLYAGRIANAIAAVVTLAWAVRLMPVAAPAAMLLGLLPMAVYEYASVSPDAATITAAFVFTALALEARQSGSWSAGRVALAASAALVFCPLKPVYAPLLLLGLPSALVPGRRLQTLLVHALIVSLVFGATLAWLRFVGPATVVAKPDTDLPSQLAFVIRYPADYVLTVARTAVQAGPFWYRSTIGELGWVNIRLQPFQYWLPVVGFALCIAAEPRRSVASRRWWFVWDMGLIAASALLIIMAMYLYYTPVGGSTVEGVQGRYFLPLAAGFAGTVSLAIGRNRFSSSQFPALLAAAFCIMLNIAAMDATLIRAYALL